MNNEDSLKEKYAVELLRLKKFREKLNSYLNRVAQNYPVDNNITEMRVFSEKLDEILKTGELSDNKNDAEKKIAIADGLFGKSEPNTTIKRADIPESESAFDLNEVLNPGQLNLEDLCRELGLTDDE